MRSWAPVPLLLDLFSLIDLRLSLDLLRVEESEVAINVSRSPRSISLVVKFLKVSSVNGRVPSNMEDRWRRVFFSFRSTEGNSTNPEDVLSSEETLTSFRDSGRPLCSSLLLCRWWCSLCFFFLLKVPFSVMSMSFDASSIRSCASSTFSRRWCWNIVGIVK